MKNTLQKIAFVFCLALVFTFISPQESLADVICTHSGTCANWYSSSGTSGSLASPTHNQTFKPGDAIRAKGDYSVDFTIGWSSGSEKCWEVGITKFLPGAKCPPSSGYSYRVSPMRYYEKTMYQDLWGKVPTCYACHTPSWEYWTTLFAKCRFSIEITKPGSPYGSSYLFGNIDSIPTKNGSKISCSFDRTFTFPDLLATNGWAPGDYNLMVYPQQYYYGLRIGEIRGCDEYDSSGQEICESNYGKFYEHIKFTVPYTCTGSVPANATIHSGDTTGLSANTAYTHNTTNTSPKCEFYCNAGYGWNGSVCVPPPTPDLKVNGLDSPASVVSGNAFTLTWLAVANATSCTGTGTGWAGAKSISGGNDAITATDSSTYTLTCTGPGGTGTDSVVVTVVAPKPTPDLKINNSDGPLTVNKGDNLNLTWPSVANATSCTGTGTGWTGAKSISGGNESIVATTLGSTSYTLTCTGPGGTEANSVAVTVVLPRYTLEVIKLGVPKSLSTVTGTGIDCGADCAETLDSGTSITLTAAAGTNAVFEGWNGACSGKENCSFTLDKNTTVNANFACKEYYELSGEVCVAVPGKCSTALESCYTSIPAKDILCAEGDPDPYPPTYFAGKWTWECKGIPNSGQCSVNQCAIYKEVTP